MRNASRLERSVARIDQHLVRVASDPRNWGQDETALAAAAKRKCCGKMHRPPFRNDSLYRSKALGLLCGLTAPPRSWLCC